MLARCYLQGLPSGIAGESPIETSSAPEAVEAEEPDLEL